MSNRIELRIFAGNDDITDDVVALDYCHGVDIKTNKLAYSGRDEIVRCTLASSNPDAHRGEVIICCGSAELMRRGLVG